MSQISATPSQTKRKALPRSVRKMPLLGNHLSSISSTEAEVNPTPRKRKRGHDASESVSSPDTRQWQIEAESWKNHWQIDAFWSEVSNKLGLSAFVTLRSVSSYHANLAIGNALGLLWRWSALASSRRDTWRMVNDSLYAEFDAVHLILLLRHAKESQLQVSTAANPGPINAWRPITLFPSEVPLWAEIEQAVRQEVLRETSSKGWLVLNRLMEHKLLSKRQMERFAWRQTDARWIERIFTSSSCRGEQVKRALVELLHEAPALSWVVLTRNFEAIWRPYQAFRLDATAAGNQLPMRRDFPVTGFDQLWIQILQVSSVHPRLIEWLREIGFYRWIREVMGTTSMQWSTPQTLIRLLLQQAIDLPSRRAQVACLCTSLEVGEWPQTHGQTPYIVRLLRYVEDKLETVAELWRVPEEGENQEALCLRIVRTFYIHPRELLRVLVGRHDDEDDDADGHPDNREADERDADGRPVNRNAATTQHREVSAMNLPNPLSRRWKEIEWSLHLVATWWKALLRHWVRRLAARGDLEQLVVLDTRLRRRATTLWWNEFHHTTLTPGSGLNVLIMEEAAENGHHHIMQHLLEHPMFAPQDMFQRLIKRMEHEGLPHWCFLSPAAFRWFLEFLVSKRHKYPWLARLLLQWAAADKREIERHHSYARCVLCQLLHEQRLCAADPTLIPWLIDRSPHWVKKLHRHASARETLPATTEIYCCRLALRNSLQRHHHRSIAAWMLKRRVFQEQLRTDLTFWGRLLATQPLSLYLDLALHLSQQQVSRGDDDRTKKLLTATPPSSTTNSQHSSFLTPDAMNHCANCFEFSAQPLSSSSSSSSSPSPQLSSTSSSSSSSLPPAPTEACAISADLLRRLKKIQESPVKRETLPSKASALVLKVISSLDAASLISCGPSSRML